METGKVFEPAVIGHMAAKATKGGSGTGVTDRMAILGADDKAQYVAIKTFKAGSLAHLWHRLTLGDRRWAQVRVAGREGLTFVNISSLAKRAKTPEAEIRKLRDVTMFLQNFRQERARRSQQVLNAYGNWPLYDVRFGNKLIHIVQQSCGTTMGLSTNGPNSLKVKPVAVIWGREEIDVQSQQWYTPINAVIPMPEFRRGS
jgi:hypothetical protein